MSDHICTNELEPRREAHELGDLIRLPHPEGHDLLLTPEAARCTGWLLQRLADTIQEEQALKRARERQKAKAGR